jgi:hypothetical protein
MADLSGLIWCASLRVLQTSFICGALGAPASALQEGTHANTSEHLSARELVLHKAHYLCGPVLQLALFIGLRVRAIRFGCLFSKSLDLR